MVVFFHSFFLSICLSFVLSIVYFIFPFIFILFNLSFSFVLLFVPSIIIFFYVSFFDLLFFLVIFSLTFHSYLYFSFFLSFLLFFFSDEAGKSDVLHLRTDVSNSAHGTHLWPFLFYDYKDIGQFMDRFHCSDESKEHENEKRSCSLFIGQIMNYSVYTS